MVSYNLSYEYDAVGNRTTMTDNLTSEVTTYTYGRANQLLSEESSLGTIDYTYDADGNRTQKDDPVAGVTDYTYDQQNRLTKVETPAAGTVSLTYNADDKRVIKATSAGTRKFIYDGEKLLQEAKADDSTEATFDFALQDEYGELTARYHDAAASSDFYMYDGLGSTENLVDEAEADLSTYQYHAFGQLAAETGATDNDFTFIGKYGGFYDSEIDLYFFSRRYQDPATGQFTTKDPAEADEENTYRYVGNNPVNAVDPSGLKEPGETGGQTSGRGNLKFILRQNKKEVPKGIDIYVFENTTEALVSSTTSNFGGLLGRVVLDHNRVEKFERFGAGGIEYEMKILKEDGLDNYPDNFEYTKKVQELVTIGQKLQRKDITVVQEESFPLGRLVPPAGPPAVTGKGDPLADVDLGVLDILDVDESTTTPRVGQQTMLDAYKILYGEDDPILKAYVNNPLNQIVTWKMTTSSSKAEWIDTDSCHWRITVDPSAESDYTAAIHLREALLDALVKDNGDYSGYYINSQPKNEVANYKKKIQFQLNATRKTLATMAKVAVTAAELANPGVAFASALNDAEKGNYLGLMLMAPVFLPGKIFRFAGKLLKTSFKLAGKVFKMILRGGHRFILTPTGKLYQIVWTKLGYRLQRPRKLKKTASNGLPATTSESVSDKLRRYLLNSEHPAGADKATWFRKALGFAQDNLDDLAKQITFDPATAVATELTKHGQKFEQVINIVGANGKRINVLFVWIRNNDGVVRLVTSTLGVK